LVLGAAAASQILTCGNVAQVIIKVRPGFTRSNIVFIRSKLWHFLCLEVEMMAFLMS